jgi:hypothetical protein
VRVRRIPAAWAVALFSAQVALGLINPSLQPHHLYDRYQAVLCLKITAIDDDKRTVDLDVLQVCKGEFALKKVLLAAGREEVTDAFFSVVEKGGTIVAFVGSPRRSHQEDVLFYPGGMGRWQVGRMDPNDSSSWEWTQDIDPAENEQLFGTFNGSPERLAEMMADKARGRYFFPAEPFVQFKDDRLIGRFDGPVRGVALYDVDRDGRLDVYACSEGGDRAYLQTAPMQFTDSTASLGLEGLKSASVSFADVNADGRPDLLAGAALFLGEAGAAGPKFRASGLLPKQPAGELKCAAFVEINADGYPDVVVSKAGGGLRVHLNPGEKCRAFQDSTAALGLDNEVCGNGLSGFFAPGDWDGDRRTDLFYAAGDGILLRQDDGGRFRPVEHGQYFDFQASGAGPGYTGAGCFAPLWRPGRLDLIFSSESSVNFAVNVSGRMREMSSYGNEITEGSFGMLAVVAEDLNADGNVDVYAASRSKLPNVFYMNRGYGSFMTPHKYKPNAFPGEAHQKGAWGVAAGDVNGDGANDLLLGGVDGTLTLMPSDVLAARGVHEHPTHQQKVLDQTKILTVHVTGRKGVLGARVELADVKGETVGLRVIGSNVSTGCRGPDTVNLAVRELGRYVLTVRFADGLKQTRPVDLSSKQHTVVEVTR